MVLTPAREGMRGSIKEAESILSQNPEYFMPDQFSNQANPAMHRKTTAVEIWEALDGKVDALVAAVGTGGTITGCGGVFKEKRPDVKVIAVEPAGSPVLSGGEPGPHRIQGIGAGFVPKVLKRSLIDPGPWRMTLYGFGECLPDERNQVEIDPEVTDAWGIPVLRIRCRWRDNELAMFDDMASQAAEMLEAAGVRNVEPFNEDNPPGKTIHEMGTARMGRDPRTSVLNAYNQAHDIENLFVVDGACMVSSANQNPSLTYMALTARACDYAVGLMRRGEL